MKKFPLVLLGILTFILIPLDLLLKEVPFMLAIICMAALVLSNIILCMDSQTKKSTKIAFSSLGGITVLLLGLCLIFVPYFGSSTFHLTGNYYAIDYQDTVSAKEAGEDLDYVIKKVKRTHPALKKGLTDEMQAKLDEARATIHSKSAFTPEELARIIEPVLSTLEDGHTLINANFAEWHNYRFFYENDSLNLVGINGKDIDELFDEWSYLISYDHPAYGKLNILNLVTALEGLEYYGVDYSNGVTYNFEDSEGNPVDKIAYPEDFMTWNEYYETHTPRDSTDNSSTTSDYKFAEYEIMPEESLGIFTLRSCRYNSEYVDLVEKFFIEVRNNNIQSVCFDIRDNGGGNSIVANEVFRYLDVDTYNDFGCTARFGPLLIDMGGGPRTNNRKDSLTFTGDFYLLTSTGSFSSAMDFAMYVKDNHLGTIIGEEPGNDPNSYGDVITFKTPHAGLYFQVSCKKWNRIDSTATDRYINPDIPCPAYEAREKLLDVISQ